jgi:hypothetical protein
LHPDKKQNGYIYRASAVAFGGQLSRPSPEPLDAQAAVVLPSGGGYDSERSEGYAYREIFRFRMARSQVVGNFSNGHHNTLATTTIEDLNIGDMLTADRVTARVAAVQREGDEGAPEYSLVGSTFVNLRVAGVKVELDYIFGRRDSLLGERGSRLLTDFPKIAKSQEKLFEPDRKEWLSGAKRQGYFPMSLFSSVRCDGLAQTKGLSIDVEQFGRIHLGEILASPQGLQLTMFRLELGCPVEGDISGGEVEMKPLRYP